MYAGLADRQSVIAASMYSHGRLHRLKRPAASALLLLERPHVQRLRSSLAFLLVKPDLAEPRRNPQHSPRTSGMEADVNEIKQAMLGNWESIALEVRPSAAKNPTARSSRFYLRRACQISARPTDFELEIVNSADPYGAVPLARIKIGGHMLWQGSHPVAPGAQKVDFVADESYEVTPLAQGFATITQHVASAGYGLGWSLAPEHIRKGLCAFALKEGTNFMEYDLVLSQGRPVVLGRRQYRRRGF